MDYLALYERHLGASTSRSGNRYRFRCPDCPSSKDPAFSIDATTGVFCCHRCGIAGNAYQFAKRYGEKFVDDGLPVALAPDTDVFDQDVATKVYTELHSRLHNLSEEAYHDLCVNRGINDPYSLGLRTINGEPDTLMNVFSEGELLLSGLFYLKDGVLQKRRIISNGRLWIPYINGVDGISYFRTRGDSKPKYLGPKGGSCKNRLWISPYMRPSDYLIVTEGELKAISAASYGIPCIGMPGMNSGRDAVLNEVHQRGVKDVIICFDTQIESAKDVIAAKRSLTRVLTSGECRVKHMELPLFNSVAGGTKMDIDSFIATAGIGVFCEMIDEVREDNGQKHSTGSPAKEGSS